jgi:hypothetical protein
VAFCKTTYRHRERSVAIPFFSADYGIATDFVLAMTALSDCFAQNQ